MHTNIGRCIYLAPMERMLLGVAGWARACGPTSTPAPVSRRNGAPRPGFPLQVNDQGANRVPLAYASGRYLLIVGP